MKKFIIYSSIALIFLIPSILQAQTGKSPNTQNPSNQEKLNEEIEKAMKNMTPQQREQMKKMMPAIMPAMLENANDYRYPEFTSNRELLYKKDIARINAIPKKKLTQADILTYTNSLFSKIMAKGDAAEITIIKSVMAKGSSATHFGNAAILCMLQGHAQAAIGLSMKAVIAEPANANWQNNMASLLTQYGYVEQAIPVLQKLRNEINDNSTILNNLAQAWFSLGEIDSAKNNSLAALKINPGHADALVVAGVIDEAQGKTEEAIKKYTKAMEQSPDGFTETLLKNSKGQTGLNNINFDKLIQNITVYNYFPKDWIQIPELSNNVSGFENDIAIKNGYAKMFINFNKDLQFKINLSQAEIKNLMNQGNEGFAIDMITAGSKHGTSFISTHVRIIVSLITIKLMQLSKKYADKKKEMREYMEQKIQEKNYAGKNDNCAAADRRNNEFLATVNYSNKIDFNFWIEEYRKWLNAYCTWTWYLTGNMKNVSLVQCLNYTKFYAELFRDAIAMQQTAAPCGVEGLNGKGETKPPTPLIPNFNCPTVVSVPVGQDWQALDNTLKNFDANSLGIKKIPGAPVPNAGIAYGSGGKHVTQAGKGPMIRYSYGFLVPQLMIGEDELAPITSQEQNDKLYREYLHKLLQSMFVLDCDELQNMKEENKKKFWEEKKRKADKKLKEQLQKEVDEITDKIKNDRITKRLGDEIRKMYEELSNNNFNFQPSLSSSVQSPNTFTPQQNLFK